MDEGLVQNTPKAVLAPRRPGEGIKVAETALKRRDINLKAVAARKAKIAEIRKSKKDVRKGNLKVQRLEKIVQQAREKGRDRIRLRIMERNARYKKKKPLDLSHSVIAVIRNGRKGGTREVKKNMMLMGIKKRHTCRIVPNDEETAKRLEVCKPFLFWGPPGHNVLHTLVQKKAVFREPNPEGGEDGRKVLSDNVLIEKHLGDLGVLCTEDLVHVLFNQAEHFDTVNRRLWPFQLDNPKLATTMVADILHPYGNKGDAINERIVELIGK